ncbi:MAG: hypothetical protein IPL39_24950 [Opitutaceae bacterium]|nr:hypothetical protein [Opitutaceae bacterium]
MNLDGNLVWTTGSAVAGYDWGIPATAWSGWQAQGFDANGLFANPGLDATYTLAPASPYFGSYGRDLASLSTDNYATWRAANFTGTDVAIDAVSGPLADPDGVGISNYARYAFALPARGPFGSPVILDTIGEGAARVLRLNFPRRATATDLSYIVESSPDLITWTPVPGRTFAPGAGPITAEDTVPIGAATRRFLRVRVTTP